MLKLFALGALLGNALTQVVDNTIFGDSIAAACPSSQISNTDFASCSTATNCGGSAAWLVEMIQAAETEAEISMIPGRVVGQNALEMYVTHGAVNGRTVDEIEVNGGVAACNYPGINWVKGVDASGSTCFDVYRAIIPWSTAFVSGGSQAVQDASGCGLTRTENATHVTFDGQATVKMTENFEFDGQTTPRKIESVVRFRLTQPKTITDITTTVSVLQDPRLLQAITEQSFDYLTGVATLKLKISTADPLLTIGTGLQVTQPAAISVNPAAMDPLVDVAGCDTSGENKSCLQEHTFILDPNEACEFDGVYSFNINVACRPDVAGTANCPISMTSMPLTVNVTLDSENICTVVEGLLEVDASMTSHGVFTPATFTFGPEKNAFFQDQTIHFKLVVDSLNEFPFESTELDEVRATATAGGGQVVVYNKNDKPNALWDFATSSDQQSSTIQHIHQFEFSPKEGSSFGAVARNMPVDSPIEADISLVFANSIGPGTRRKRTIRIEPEEWNAMMRKRQMVNNERTATAGALVTLEPGPNAPDVPGIQTTAAASQTSGQPQIPASTQDENAETLSGTRSAIALSVAALVAAAALF